MESREPHDDDGQQVKPVTSDVPAEGWRRRRVLDDVFGTELPDVTSDESDEGHNPLSDQWYESNRPPHHG